MDCFGDFNQVLNMKDKLFFKNNSLKGANLFKDCLDTCNLSEMPSKGIHWTWTNNREGNDIVWERLDRCFANPAWFNKHEPTSLLNLPVWESDHGAMIIYTQKDLPFHRRSYRFEAMWDTHPIV
ncbi:hypothetical protein PTKIN_Ptkin05aG0115900 [Pterospermum kingtungense]